MIDQKFYQTEFLERVEIPPVLVEEVVLFHHTAMVKVAGAVGISTIVGRDSVSSPRDCGSLHLENLKSLSSLYLSDNYLEAAIGMASINCAINLKVVNQTCEFNAYNFLDGRQDKTVSVIGRFPFVERLVKQNKIKKIYCFELTPKTGEIGPERYADFIPISDVVIITATTFVNKTFHKIYQHLNDFSFNILAGPTTPLLPLLFDYKINALSGLLVEDYHLARQTFSQGGASRHAKGVKKITITKNGI